MRKKGTQVFDNEGPNRYSNLGVAPAASSIPEEGMDQLLSGTSTFNPRDVQNAMKKLGTGEAVLEKMPMADQPPEIATVLLPYRRQSLQWMLDHESPKLPEKGDDLVQLWKKVRQVLSQHYDQFCCQPRARSCKWWPPCG